MVRSILKTFVASLSPCVGSSRPEDSATTPAENTENVPNGHTTMRCFLVLTFWISALCVVSATIVYGGPKLWTLIGLMASPNSLP